MNQRARPGLAVAALAIIGAVTAVWWVLALYPVGRSVPEWVERTRLACFGAAPGGLPNAGGWILLAGQPVGMLAMLLAVWRAELLRDLRATWSHAAGRLVLAAAGALLLASASWVVGRVQTAIGSATPFLTNAAGQPERLSVEAPGLILTDQHGAPFDLAGMRGRVVIVTFAYSHCGAVCPMLVHQVKTARSDAGRADLPLVVVTLDPWRDVVTRLPAIAAAWELGAADRVLSGDIAAVNAALDSWGVQRSRDESTGELDHIPVVLVVDGAGRLAWRFGGDVRALAQVLGDS